MAVYRNDADLHLLGQCSNEELQLLISILTTDPRDGDTRWKDSLTSTPEYRLLAPDHRRYWQLIAAELQRYGANTDVRSDTGYGGNTLAEISVCSRIECGRTPPEHQGPYHLPGESLIPGRSVK